MEVLGIVVGLFSIALAIVAIWLSITFHRIAIGSADRSVDVAHEIEDRVGTVETLLDRLNHDTFSVLAEVLRTAVTRGGGGEEQYDRVQSVREARAELRAEVGAIRQEADRLARLASANSEAERPERRGSPSRARLHGPPLSQAVATYEPQKSLATGGVVAFECHLSWREAATVPVPTADLTHESVLWLLAAATAEAASWPPSHSGAKSIAVDVPCSLASTSEFRRFVEALLDSKELPAGALCLELSETDLADAGAGEMSVALAPLRKLGVKIAVDQFGIGYSSLAYLKWLSPEVLKIDESFIDGLRREPESDAVVAAVVELSHSLELTTVALGVSRTEQLQQLQALGCDAAQGPIFGPPRLSTLPGEGETSELA